MGKFSFNPSLDVSFIPFLPATEQDNVETRVQVRKLDKNAKLDIKIAVDDIVLLEENSVVTGDFYFKKFLSKFTAGIHKLKVFYKTSEEKEYAVGEREFTIEKERKPLLQGGFIMLGPPNDRLACSAFTRDTKNMSDADWENLIDEMFKFGINCVIITVTVQLNKMKGPNTAHFNSKLYPRSDIKASDPIRAVLNSAERNGQSVFIGLGHTYGGNLPDTPDIMDELFSLYGDSPAFYGWYESEEVNMKKNKKRVWKRWKIIREHANKLSPVKPVITSPYADGKKTFKSTGGLNPKFLNKIGKGLGAFDILAPQDMVGHTVKGGRQTVKETYEMFRILKEQCKNGGKHLWANVEAFDFFEDEVLVPRFVNGGMDGENGYIQQIQSAFPHVEKIITFMLNGFFTPPDFKPMLGGEKAVNQYVKYNEYRNKVLSKT